MPKSVLRAVLGRMQFTLHATRRTPYDASRLVQAISASLVKTRRAPSRHSRDATVYGHTTTAVHKPSTPPPALPFDLQRDTADSSAAVAAAPAVATVAVVGIVPRVRPGAVGFLSVAAGMDAYCLVRFNYLCLRICTFASFWGMLVLTPVYALTGSDGEGIYYLTLANVSEGSNALVRGWEGGRVWIGARRYWQVMDECKEGRKEGGRDEGRDGGGGEGWRRGKEGGGG